jgi:hypothetical protein
MMLLCDKRGYQYPVRISHVPHEGYSALLHHDQPLAIRHYPFWPYPETPADQEKLDGWLDDVEDTLIEETLATLNRQPAHRP